MKFNPGDIVYHKSIGKEFEVVSDLENSETVYVHFPRGNRTTGWDLPTLVYRSELMLVKGSQWSIKAGDLVKFNIPEQVKKWIALKDEKRRVVEVVGEMVIIHDGKQHLTIPIAWCERLTKTVIEKIDEAVTEYVVKNVHSAKVILLNAALYKEFRDRYSAFDNYHGMRIIFVPDIKSEIEVYG